MAEWKRSPAAWRGFPHVEGDPKRSLYLRPVGLLSGMAARAALAGGGRTLAGGPLAFTACEIVLRHRGSVVSAVAPLDAVAEWGARQGEPVAAHLREVLDRLCAPRPPFAGIAMDRPAIMGIINVTPDSFSDGGRFAEAEAAIAHGRLLREAGADILDVGGESTRPGSAPLPEAEELRRIIPVVQALAAEGAVVSVDTRHARVMAEALEAGAAIVNDITALSASPEALALVAMRRTPVVLMHMQGTPETMQLAPRYDFAPLDIYDYLSGRIEACVAAGLDRGRIVIDPGIGFGKTVAHNLELMACLSLFQGLGCGVLLGASRKSFIGRLSRGEAPTERIPGSLAAALAGLSQGAQILRVHDVAETRQAVAVWEALWREDVYPGG